MHLICVPILDSVVLVRRRDIRTQSTLNSALHSIDNFLINSINQEILFIAVSELCQRETAVAINPILSNNIDFDVVLELINVDDRIELI